MATKKKSKIVPAKKSGNKKVVKKVKSAALAKTKTKQKPSAVKKKPTGKPALSKKAVTKKPISKKPGVKKTSAKKNPAAKTAKKKSTSTGKKLGIAAAAVGVAAATTAGVVAVLASNLKAGHAPITKAGASAAKPVATKEPASKSQIQIDSQVPTVTLKDQSGHDIDLGETLSSSPWTVLYFYPKDDTPGCTKQACSFRDHFNNVGQSGLQVIGVSPDSSADHLKFTEKYSLNFTLLSDPERKLIEHFKLWQKKQYMGKEYMGVERTTLLVEGDTIAYVWQPVSVEGHTEDVIKKFEELRT